MESKINLEEERRGGKKGKKKAGEKRKKREKKGRREKDKIRQIHAHIPIGKPLGSNVANG